MEEPLYAELQEISRDAEWDHVVILPMRFGDRDLGTIETYYRDDEQPDEREIALVFAMARQAAAAIENALLFDQTEQRVGYEEGRVVDGGGDRLELVSKEIEQKLGSLEDELSSVGQEVA